MFYKLLGMAVWHGGKVFLKRRYGTYVPKPVLAGAVVAAAGGVAFALVAAKRNGSGG
jgi:hypothetical protein